MLGRVVNLELLCQTPCFSRGKRLVKGRSRMCVQIVHYNDERRSVTIRTVAEVPNEMGEVDLGAVRGGLDHGLAFERLDTKEDIGGPATLVLVIYAGQRTRRCRYRDSGMLKHLLTRLIDADLRPIGIIRSPVDFEYIFHRRNERGVLFRWNAKPLGSPRF